MSVDALVTAGLRRARLAKQLTEAENELRALVLDAHAQGVPIVELHRLGGVSKVTIHKWINNARAAA